MCGIIAGIKKGNIVQDLIGCLKKLEYRGYDSAGLACFENSRIERYRSVGRVSELEKIVDCYKKYKSLIENIESGKEMLSSEKDEEMKSFAKEEIERSEKDKIDLEKEIRILLIPKDPNDDKNLILEIRAGTGGDEAALFASDLYRIYVRYAERNNWDYKIMDSSDTGIGGIKEVIISINGKGAL